MFFLDAKLAEVLDAFPELSIADRNLAIFLAVASCTVIVQHGRVKVAIKDEIKWNVL